MPRRNFKKLCHSIQREHERSNLNKEKAVHNLNYNPSGNHELNIMERYGNGNGNGNQEGSVNELLTRLRNSQSPGSKSTGNGNENVNASSYLRARNENVNSNLMGSELLQSAMYISYGFIDETLTQNRQNHRRNHQNMPIVNNPHFNNNDAGVNGGPNQNQPHAGPPPPKSWRSHTVLARKRSDKLVGNNGQLISLQSTCLFNISKNLPYYLKNPDVGFSLIPAFLKEQILDNLSNLTLSNQIPLPLTDEELTLFQDQRMERLNLRSAMVTAQGLEILAPKMIRQDNPGASNWEDLLEEDRLTLIGCPQISEINVAFCLQLEGSHFAHVVTHYWAFLTSLNIAGCFNRLNGPPALTLFAQELYNLLCLDLSFCDWVTLKLMLSFDWQMEFKRLQTLTILGNSKVSNGLEEILREKSKKTYLTVLSE